MSLPLLLCLYLAAVSFWDTQGPKDWSEEQMLFFMSASPWARPAEAMTAGPGALPVSTLLATAKPMRAAEVEWRKRRFKKDVQATDMAWEEYQEFLERDEAKFIVLAVNIPPEATRDAEEMALMENESVLRVGKTKHKMAGYFPPSPTDPWTRLIFTRRAAEGAKELNFELYVPGTGAPYRLATYPVKQCFFEGKPAL